MDVPGDPETSRNASANHSYQPRRSTAAASSTWIVWTMRNYGIISRRCFDPAGPHGSDPYGRHREPLNMLRHC